MGLFAVRHSEREKGDKKKLKGKARRYTCACRSEKKIQSAETRCGKPVIKFATVNQVRASGSMPGREPQRLRKRELGEKRNADGSETLAAEKRRQDIGQ